MRKALPIATSQCRDYYERAAQRRGFTRIAGADEVGRGCLFGPVYAAAVILSPDRPVRGLRDSKELEPERREELALLIQERAVAWAVSWLEADEIDRINIYHASLAAMKRAVESLQPAPDFVLVDGFRLPGVAEQRALIKGDTRCRSIAAASIVAKVARDQRMREWHETYPQYGFARHKGYGTPEHLAALAQHGVTPEHRRTFSPVRDALEKTMAMRVICP